jgi:Xaa-Pro aminopeptidase
LEIKYSGVSSQDKVCRIREELTKKKVKAVVVNMLDEVAWLFNLRGGDIDFNPGEHRGFKRKDTVTTLPLLVFFAYTVITHDSITLFVDPAQIDDVVRNHLGPEVDIQPYDSFFQFLEGLGDKLGLKKDAVSLTAFWTRL